MILKTDFILAWGWQRGKPLLKEFQTQLDKYVEQEIKKAVDKEFNRLDCE